MSTSANNWNFSWAPKPWTRAPGVPAWTEYFHKANGDAPVPADDIRRCTTAEPMVWGATFDDGPSPFTPELLEYFKIKNLKTTFYTIGSTALSHPQIMLDTFNAGHEIGIHTWSHPNLTSVASDDEIIAEFVYSAKIIHQVTGQAIRYIRPPYGSSNSRVRRLAALMGLEVVSYLDAQDWLNYNDQAKMEPVVMGHVRKWISEKRTKEISLHHDMYNPQVQVSKKAMDSLISAGYTIKPVYQCLDQASPYGNRILEGFFRSGQFESRNATIHPLILNELFVSNAGKNASSVVGAEVTPVPLTKTTSDAKKLGAFILFAIFAIV